MLYLWKWLRFMTILCLPLSSFTDIESSTPIASGGKPNRNGVSVPLRRTKRGLKDMKGVPTENLKGRPGQGYYIAVEMGTPPQRVCKFALTIAK